MNIFTHIFKTLGKIKRREKKEKRNIKELKINNQDKSIGE